MAKSNPQLDYAPPLPWVRTRRAHRWMIWGVLFIAVAAAIWNWKSAWHAVRLAYLHHQLVSTVLREDKVIFEADPFKASALLKGDSHYRRELSGDSRNQPMIASWQPSNFGEFVSLATRAPGTSFRANPPVVFVGERSRSGDGKRVLLVVRFEGFVVYTGGMMTYTFNYDQYGQDVGFAGEDVATRQAMIPRAGYFERIFAAQADPSDPTHISFRYVVKGKEGIIDAWLDNDVLRMKARTGPAATQPTVE